MIMYENYQYGNYRRGCGTLKASGGDYGGGSENLICTNTGTVGRSSTLSPQTQAFAATNISALFI